MLGVSYVVIVLVMFFMNSDLRFLLLQTLMLMVYIAVGINSSSLSWMSCIFLFGLSLMVFNLVVWVQSLNMEIVYGLILLSCSLFLMFSVSNILELFIVAEIVGFAMLVQVSSLNLSSLIYYYIVSYLGGLFIMVYYMYCTMMCHSVSIGLTSMILSSSCTNVVGNVVMIWIGMKMYLMPLGLWVYNYYHGIGFEVLITVTVQIVMVFWLFFFDVWGYEGISWLVPTAYSFLVLVILVVVLTWMEASVRVFLGLGSMVQAGFMIVHFSMYDGWTVYIFSWYILLYGICLLTIYVIISKVGDSLRFLETRFQGWYSMDGVSSWSLMVTIFGVAGLPVTYIFLNKILIFQALRNIGIVLFLIVVSFIYSILYYFRFLKTIAFSEPAECSWWNTTGDYCIGRILFVLLYILY